MAKVKVKWYKRPIGSGLEHSVREGQSATVCGVIVGADWLRGTGRGTRCQKCVAWEPLGRGPGGWSKSQQRKAR